MCINCWKESGSTAFINDRVIAAAKLVKELYETDDGSVGGYGHIVFDDWNTSDGDIESCLRDLGNDENILSEETTMASMRALNAFKDLSEDERESALAIVDGFIKVDL